MITCNRCGRQVTAGLANCQYCGMPLQGKSRSGTNPGMGTSEQSELPAWLESLRANERPVPPAQGQQNFSSADLIDEGTLPSWMRSDRADSISNKHPALRPSSMPGPNTDGDFITPKSFTASSLVDEQSLPSWMQEKLSETEFSTPQPPSQQHLAASSLVQPDGMPEWMKSIQQQAPQSPAPFQQAGPVSQQKGVSADDLIDQQSIPPWMANQNSAPSFGQGNQPAFERNTPPPRNEQHGFSASSLLDMNALPSWLRESSQERNRQGPEPNLPDQPGQTPNSNIAGASFVDVNALPEWLRSVADQRQGGSMPSQPQGVGGNPRQGSFSVPSRVENVRVPNRPRSEKEAHEESAVAANVFASMLGVASAAPNFPMQPQGGNFAQQQGPQNWQAQPQQGMPPQQNPMSGGAPPTGYPGQQQGYMPGGYQGEGYPMRTPSGMLPPQTNTAGMSPEPTMPGQQKANTKSNKRGFLDTIRGWFSH